MTCFAVSVEGTVVIGWRSLLLRQYILDDCKCTRSWKVWNSITKQYIHVHVCVYVGHHIL